MKRSGALIKNRAFSSLLGLRLVPRSAHHVPQPDPNPSGPAGGAVR